MNINKILKKIGLTESEKKVYITLLELGDSTRGTIVNKSEITGSKVYEILEKLQNKGLVSIYLKNKVKHFKPTNPTQILNYLEKKREEILSIEKQTKDILPTLLAKYNSSKENQEVELISGMKGLEMIFREQVDLLKKGETCYVIGGTKGMDEDEVIAFFRKIHVMREAKKIKSKMLFNSPLRKTYKNFYPKKEFPGTNTRYIEHSSPVAINVYKNRTVIIIFGSGITSIYIKSQDVANSFGEYFNLLWKSSKK